jgi:diguanylate cyclase (GGDEF)-like protein
VLLGGRGGRAWLLLALGLLVNGATNTIYLYQSATGAYTEGGWINAGWPAAATLIAAAAWSLPAPTAARADDDAAATRMSDALASAFSILIVAVLLLDAFHPVPVAARLLLTAAVVALLTRLGLALRERRRLISATGLEARTDELTGLANRRLLYAAADAALASGQPLSALLLDLNRFKDVNDTLGHNAGDELLRQVAERLEPAPGGDALVSRVGGDEFVVLLPGIGTEADAVRVAERLRAALDEPFEVEGLALSVRASVGIGLAPKHAQGRAELLRCADVAMYRAKARQTSIEIYQPDADAFKREDLELVSELRRAIADGGELLLHYQPKRALPDGRLVGVEALIRWQHPRLGLLAPARFLWLAEREGLMRELTLAVLDGALAQQSAWRRAGRHVPIAVNLSTANLLDARLPAEVEALMRAHGTVAGDLELEITEGTLMHDPVRALDVIAQISELGITFSLDDFGTGYSSLAQLRRLPVRFLKIDRSFIQSMGTSPEDANIVRSTIQLAHSLKLGVVAEGVETEAHLRALAAYGCDVAQGFHLGRPCPAEQLFGPGPEVGAERAADDSRGRATTGS